MRTRSFFTVHIVEDDDPLRTSIASLLRSADTGVDEKPFAAIERAMIRDCERWEMRQRDTGLRTKFASLSPRQREVLALVARGRMNRVIAAELGIASSSFASRTQLASRILGPYDQFPGPVGARFGGSGFIDSIRFTSTRST